MYAFALVRRFEDGKLYLEGHVCRGSSDKVLIGILDDLGFVTELVPDIEYGEKGDGKVIGDKGRGVEPVN